MVSFLHTFFHNQTRNRSEQEQFGLLNKDVFSTELQQEEIVYKQYSLYKKIPLDKTDGCLLNNLLSKRKSSNNIAENNLTLSTISYILKCGYGLQNRKEERKENRTVPSAGKKYPLEIYLFMFKQIEGCVPGIYHYNVQQHALELILDRHFSKQDIESFTSVEWLQDSNVIICITGVFNKTTSKYGNRGYRYVLLEAGHVAQNILLSGVEKNISIIPIGGVNEKEIEDIIGLHTDSEKAVYTLFM